MPEDPAALAAEAAAVLARCEALMEETVEEGRSLEGDRAAIIGARDDARERENRAYEKMALARDAGRRDREAERAFSAAGREASRADRLLASGELDPEYRKAVARQMAALARDDVRRELSAIAARGDDPTLSGTVEGYEEDAVRAARYVARMFAPARELEPGEVRKARAEAREILDGLGNSPASRNAT